VCAASFFKNNKDNIDPDGGKKLTLNVAAGGSPREPVSRIVRSIETEMSGREVRGRSCFLVTMHATAPVIAGRGEPQIPIRNQGMGWPAAVIC
jgi:hypothetical protein